MKTKWICNHCRKKFEKDFSSVEWNLTCDKCGDIKGLYIYVTCPGCFSVLYSEVNEK
jgi:ribosomal protein S27E